MNFLIKKIDSIIDDILSDYINTEKIVETVCSAVNDEFSIISVDFFDNL